VRIGQHLLGAHVASVPHQLADVGLHSSLAASLSVRRATPKSRIFGCPVPSDDDV
jgi:hypothetical protein